MEKRPASSERSPASDVRSVRTRTALAGAFLALLEKHPLETVTIRDVVAMAGVSYATYFRHYRDKDALLDAVAADEIRQLIAMTMPLLFTVDSRASCKALCAYVWEHRTLWTVLLTGGAAGVLKKQFIDQARAFGTSTAQTNAVIPLDLHVVFCVSGTLEILAWWLQHGQAISIDRMAEITDLLAVAPHVSPTMREAIEGRFPSSRSPGPT